MRSAAYSILTTVLLLAPISAVPLMAIFGVPQFTPVVASPLDETEESDDWDQPPRKKSRSKAPENLPSDEESDLFDEESLDWDQPPKERPKPARQPKSRSRERRSGDEEPEAVAAKDRKAGTKSRPPATGNKSRRSVPLADPTDDVVEFASSETTDEAPPEVGLADFQQEVEQPSPAKGEKLAGDVPSGYRRTRSNSNSESDRGPEKSAGRSKRTAAPVESLTWGKAVVRLNELGIRNFKLEPGTQPGEFTFTCSYTPTNSPHVTRRFEAEADDPLKAVAQVLAQVERWAQQKDAGSSKRTAELPRDVN